MSTTKLHMQFDNMNTIFSIPSNISCLKHSTYTILFCTGAVALKNWYQSSTRHFVNTELQCSGLESNITTCAEDLDEAYSCLSFGIASVSCHCEFYSNFYCLLSSKYTALYIDNTQLESSLMHLALMEQYDSPMGTSLKRAGWRSASTMPGVLCVMMDGTMQMLL